MPQADGTILIDTEINADGMKAGSKEVEAAVRRMTSSVDDMGTKAKTALNKQVDAFVKLNQEYAAQSRKVDELKKKVSEYGNQKILTDEYREIQNQITQATTKMDRLIAQQERFLNMGGSPKSNTYKRYQYDIDELANTIRYAEGELRDLEETGKAFTLGSSTKEASADMEKLAAAERKLSDMNNRLGTSYSSIKGQVNDYNNSLLKTDSAQKKASTSGNKLSKSIKDTGKNANSAHFGITKMLGTSILFSAVFQAISAVTGAIKDGFTNLAQYSGSTNKSISMLWSSLERLKNSLATAFAPILDVVAPILSKFIDMLSTAASYVSMFFAFLSGKSTYTRAVAVQKDYAASLQDTSQAASDVADETERAAEAAEGYLSPIDEINKIGAQNNIANTSPGTGGGGGGAGGGTGSGPLFEEVAIDNKFASLLDSVLDKLKEIRDIFMAGFWDGLGNYKPILAELQADLQSIGEMLKEIFTDPAVVDSASNFARSWIYALGQITGSLARIGLTIAQNLVGGVEKFLAQEKDRIKNYLVEMFNVGAEVGQLLGNLAVAIADIFSVFGSDTAQQITGNIISIFAEVGMMVSENALKLGRDILTMIAQPIIDNKDLIKDALMGTLEAIEPFTSGILILVQNIRDGITDIYDNHLKPFFDSVAEGFSAIFGALLEGYNTYMVPVLEGLGQKFQELMDGPVGIAIDQIVEFIGKLIDALKLLWETVLVPLFTWIAENIMPVLSTIVQYIGENVLNILSLIAEAIGNLADVLSGIIDFLVGVFTGDWELAWTGIQEIFSGVWELITGILSSAWEFITTLITNALDVVKEVISTGWNGIKTLTSSVWKTIKNVLSTTWDTLKKLASSTFEAIGDTISSIWETIQDVTGEIWNGIQDTISGIVESIADKVSSVFEGMRDAVSGIFESLVGLVKSPLNTIIDFLNRLIGAAQNAWNTIADFLSFSIDIPWPISELTGWGSFSLSVPRIDGNFSLPYLASGAVIPPNSPFMAVLGDQNRGTNIEAPLETIKQAVRDVVGENSGGVYHVSADVSGRTLLDIVIDEAELRQRRNGSNPFMLA